MRVIVVLLLAGCTEANPRLEFERQALALAQTTEGGWSKGGAVIVGDPNTFTFPAPVSIRMKIVDSDTNPDAPMELAISAAEMIPYGEGPFEIAVAPMCEATACTAQLSVTAQGSSMVHVTAMGPKGPETDCFYYALVDATVDSMALFDELEAKQSDCKYSK
jgi:hypothetical protein